MTPWIEERVATTASRPTKETGTGQEDDPHVVSLELAVQLGVDFLGGQRYEHDNKRLHPAPRRRQGHARRTPGPHLARRNGHHRGHKLGRSGAPSRLMRLTLTPLASGRRFSRSKTASHIRPYHREAQMNRKPNLLEHSSMNTKQTARHKNFAWLICILLCWLLPTSCHFEISAERDSQEKPNIGLKPVPCERSAPYPLKFSSERVTGPGR